VYNVVWAKPQQLGNFRVRKVTFNRKLHKTLGEQDVLVAPPIILLELLPLLSRFGSGQGFLVF